MRLIGFSGSEKARSYVVNITENSRHEEVKRVGSWVAVC